jgi:PAS domain S-box-containing protein
MGRRRTASESIASSISPDMLREIAAAELDAPDSSVSVFDGDGACLFTENGPAWSGQPGKDVRRRLAAAVMRNGRPDVTEDPANVQTYSVPVFAGKRPAGVIQLTTADAGDRREAVRRRLCAVARLMGALLTPRPQARLVDLSRDAIISATADRVITAWNRGAEETYGWTAAEAAGKTVHGLLQTGPGTQLREIDFILLGEGRWEGELRHTRKDGVEIVVESCQALVRDGHGLPAAILEINRDITARKRAEEALRESEQWLRFGQQATGVGIGDIDLVARKWKCSDQFYRLYGFEPDDPGFNYDTLLARIHSEDREGVLARAAAAREGREPFEAEFRVVAPHMPERWVAAKATVFFDGARPVRVIAATLDITERKRSEQAHYNAQQLESVGLLAAGIAHDFNNLLTGILGNASLLLPDLEGDRAEQVQSIMTGAQKAAELTRQLLAYAGKGRFVVREIDLAEIVRDMADLARVSIPRQVEVRRVLHAARVTADGGQIQQVVMSLVMNAAEAIGESSAGCLSISTGTERLDTPFSSATGDTLPPGLYAYLEVADTGCGMDEATRARVFDPFFTTKFLGRGMGLAAVAGIMRSHRGGIRIDTAPGKGSTFRVLIPSAQVTAPATRPRVLVVDDEETVREFMTRVLEGRGFEVACAANGQEALEAIEEYGGEIGLVVLDAVMPVMGGGETLAAIRTRKPDQKVLLTSGYSEDEVQRLFGAVGEATFIQKPYTAQQLAEKVKEVLRG